MHGTFSFPKKNSNSDLITHAWVVLNTIIFYKITLKHLDFFVSLWRDGVGISNIGMATPTKHALDFDNACMTSSRMWVCGIAVMF